MLQITFGRLEKLKMVWPRLEIFILFALFLSFLLVFPIESEALTITTPTAIIFEQDGSVNPSVLAGQAEFSQSGYTLSIQLTNTSTGPTGGAASTNLLTGIGFNLPTGYYITSGSVSMAGSTAINFTAPSNNNVSGEWGYDNAPLTAGAFKEFSNSSFLVNTVVCAMESCSKDGSFSNVSLGQPAGLGGPDFGLLSNNQSSVTLGNGLEGISNSVLISLKITGGVTDLLGYIGQHDVVFSFGSPNAVPIPGTFPLMGVGVLALLWLQGKMRYGPNLEVEGRISNKT